MRTIVTGAGPDSSARPLSTAFSPTATTSSVSMTSSQAGWPTWTTRGARMDSRSSRTA